MSVIRTEIAIARSIQDVFDYVTTPANWLEWHPSSVRITGTKDGSLEVGDSVTEEFVVAGKRGAVTWTVTERRVPDRWVIAGHVVAAGGGDIAYTLTEAGDKTHFTRVFSYRMDNWLLRLLDKLMIRRRIEDESAEALRRLKAALEP